MRYCALAADYDGTLAHDGRVHERVIAGLRELAASGRKLILVTGRELNALLGIFPDITLFDRVVAENGALLFHPSTGERKLLTEKPLQTFIDELRRRRVPIAVGASIVATVRPHETTVIEVIRDLGLEFQITFNKGAVMVLPAGINKASGLVAALAELGVSPRNVVAVGDGENDHAMLALAEYSVAVANAIPMLKEKADRTTGMSHGDGVLELISDLVNDLRNCAPPIRRHIQLGLDNVGRDISIPAARGAMLATGDSPDQKSRLANTILKSLHDFNYQFCLLTDLNVDAATPYAITLGSSDHAPTVEEVLGALNNTDVSVTVNLAAKPPSERPLFINELLGALRAARTVAGRPHYLIYDDACTLPAEAPWDDLVEFGIEAGFVGFMSDAKALTPGLTGRVHAIVAIGESGVNAVTKLASWPGAGPGTPASEALIWRPGAARPPAPFVIKHSTLPAATELAGTIGQIAKHAAPAGLPSPSRSNDTPHL